jgi:hydantoinase/carbamoylase family amidase
MSEGSTLRADFEALAEIGRSPEGGWSRPAFGEEDRRAHEWFIGRAIEAGLSVRTDAIGNVIARLEGRPGMPAVAIGSHLDTVLSGGAFDGAIGVLAGLEVARRIRGGKRDCPVPIEVIAFRDEEGHYGAFNGSRAMMGELPAEEIGRRRSVDGTTLTAALRGAGFDPETVAKARRDPSEFAVFLELHIEQGAVLEKAGLDLGIVTSIVGQERMSVRFTGAADHAGTTPMGMRRDAFAAAARFADRFRDLVVGQGEGVARGTVGIVQVAPNQGNVVPGEVRLGLERRDVSAARLKRLAEATAALAGEVATAMQVDVSVRTVYRAEPVAMSEEVRAVLSGAALAEGASAMDLPSGANHDTGIMAAHLPVGMLFVPSCGGRSHCPEEHTDWPYIETAARVMERAVRELAGRIAEGERVGN